MSVPFVITFIHLHYITSCRWSRAVSQMLDVSDLIAPFINLWQDHTEEAFSSGLIENNDMSLQECTAVLLLSSNQTQISHYGNQSLPPWSLKHDCSAVCSFFLSSLCPLSEHSHTHAPLLLLHDLIWHLITWHKSPNLIFASGRDSVFAFLQCQRKANLKEIRLPCVQENMTCCSLLPINNTQVPLTHRTKWISANISFCLQAFSPGSSDSEVVTSICRLHLWSAVMWSRHRGEHNNINEEVRRLTPEQLPSSALEKLCVYLRLF